jgi:hypothetical protein
MADQMTGERDINYSYPILPTQVRSENDDRTVLVAHSQAIVVFHHYSQYCCAQTYQVGMDVLESR